MLLYVAGILSANLAVVNILPFPPLDGGRMLMITLKRIFARRIRRPAEQLTYVVGFVFLFAFIIWDHGFDIARSLRAAVGRDGLARLASGRVAGRPSASTSAACSSGRRTRSSSSR
jgi:Zn-dependent protease